ncbi:hypothetical protein [Zoogloea sp.]|uniref:hypothetical protein n=1 Tax=Zoogloea sp. TaxID=49181 RepID=UPI0025F40B5D|nr:hypothetical protein [Zoogloea sp.]HPI62330.1 hypothetical protein [Zoogloea sp.]
MHEYRQALMRLRQGDSEREIARSGLMGRAKAARFRELACEKGWLELTRPLPADAEIAAVGIRGNQGTDQLVSSLKRNTAINAFRIDWRGV